MAAVGEGGLLGLAVDPEFERNSFVYLYRTTDSGNEVLRYRFEGDRLEEDGTRARRPGGRGRSTTAGGCASAPTACCT